MSLSQNILSTQTHQVICKFHVFIGKFREHPYFFTLSATIMAPCIR